MRESLVVPGDLSGRVSNILKLMSKSVLPKAAVVVVAFIATVCCGTIAVSAAGAGAGVMGTKGGKKKQAAADLPAPALPNGHVGQEYETRIGGVMLSAGEEPHCTAITGLPSGLELNCRKMLIHGHPRAAVSDATVSFTVADDEQNSVSVKFTLTVLDGPDVVQWAPMGGKAKGNKAQAAPAAGGKAKAASQPAVSGGAGKHAALASAEAEPEADREAVASAPAADAVSVRRSEVAAARVISAIARTGAAERTRDGEGAAVHGGGKQDNRHDTSGVGIELDPETPFVEGATTIKGKIVNNAEQVSTLCVALRQDEAMPDAGSTRSYTQLTGVKGNPCLAVEAQVQNHEFSMTLMSPLKAGFKYEFEAWNGTTREEIVIKDPKNYGISPGLPMPTVEVTSLIRDGAKTISGTCKALPNPVLATNAAATPAVVGNLPRVVVELHDPNGAGGLMKKKKEKRKEDEKPSVSSASGSTAPGGSATVSPPIVAPAPEGSNSSDPNNSEKPVPPIVEKYRLEDDQQTEWYTADLLVGDTKSQKTVQSDEATATADGCVFSVTLKTALAPGQLVRVKLKAPAGRHFVEKDEKSGKSEERAEVMWPKDNGVILVDGGTKLYATEDLLKPEGRVAYTSLQIAPPLITSHMTAGTTSITGTATPSPSNGTQVTIAAISDDEYEDLHGKNGVKDHDKDGQTYTKNKELAGKDETSKTKSTGKKAEFSGFGQLEAKKPIEACRSPEEMKKYSGRFLSLASGSSTVTSTVGTFTLTLASPLVDGQRFHLVEIMPAKTKLTEADEKDCQTTVTEVKGDLDWGRIHADFVGGVLISNDSGNSTTGGAGAGSGNFSQAHQFLALSVEKSWQLPGCYLRVPAHTDQSLVDAEDGDSMMTNKEKNDKKDKKKQSARKRKDGQAQATASTGNEKGPNGGDDTLSDKEKDAEKGLVPAGCFDWSRQQLVRERRFQKFEPGVSTYFQTRLTAIPVSTVSTTPATTGTVTSSSANIISTAQTARVEVGTYFPVFLTRWDYERHPNALFIAPLAKVGFDTVTGPKAVNTTAVGGVTTQSQTLEQVYTYWSYGMKVGHMELTRSENKAPETFSYLDISFGPYSSLQSYICHSGTLPIDPATTKPITTNSTCSSDYGPNLAFDSRKRLYRFDVEGLLKIPKTLFYVGLNANIGQKTLGTTHLDHGFAAPDDIRFLFGTKFDIASVLSKFKLGPQ